jgi:hypothetical protein
MARRWYVPLLALPVVIGTVVAVAVGVASASPGLTRHAGSTAALGPTAVGRLFPGSPMIRPSGAAFPGQGNEVNPTGSSENWAGYAVQSTRPGTFRSVSASWVQPVAHCAGVAGHRFAAFWVGLDGANPPISNSVEQTGTDSDCVGRHPSYYGWYEMFPAPSVNLPNKVGAGDHMFASVTFRGTKTYVLVLRDTTRHWTRTITRNEAGLARSSAEVIAESPALDINGQLVIQPLANFGTIRWTGSKVNGTLLKKLGRRIRITMADPGGRIKAVTSPVSSADLFTNAYRHAT